MLTNQHFEIKNMLRFITVRAVALVPVLALAFLAGCGGGQSIPMPDYGSEEGLKVAQAVSNFNDAKANANKFKAMFVANAPSNWKEYDKYTYEVAVGSPKVDGTNATATVTIHKESNYEVLATKEWTFSKVGEAWKIKSAPLF